MRVAVTGASGFIGKELLSILSKIEDTSVIALTRGENCVTENGSHVIWVATDYSVESLTDIFRGVCEGDIVDACHVDAVIHLAGVRGTENDPEKFRINETITSNILSAMKDAGVNRIVFASTISVYDDEDLIPWTEDSPLKGRTQYGESKIRCEELIRSHAADYGYTYGIARIAQVIGSGEKRRGMINVFMDAAAYGGQLKVIGRSVAKRQYIYVKDLANLLLILTVGNSVYSADSNLIVNAGMPKAYTNLEIARIVNKVYGNKTPINYDDSHQETIRPSCMNVGYLEETVGMAPCDVDKALEDIRRNR